MKLMHLSDLHIGRRLHERSLLEDQEVILEQILDMAAAEAPDGVILAGDVYDKTVPSAEAVELFDRFLVELAERVPHIFLISGNHDSPERVAFGGRLMDARGVHVAPVYAGAVEPVTLEDAHGPVDFWLLPFIKPIHVRRFFPEAVIESYTDALSAAVGQMALDPARRNVLVTHQFVTGASVSGSEELSVGGTDNVDADVFDGFDYVALGHLHGPQHVSRPGIRYSGSPLKYSFNEVRQEKSVTVVTLAADGSVDTRFLPLKPLRDMRQIRGSFEELIHPSVFDTDSRQDYLQVILTDEDEIPDAIGRLRKIYPNVLNLDYDNTHTRSAGAFFAEAVPEKPPLEIFEDFYTYINNRSMSEEQRSFLQTLLEEEGML